MEKGAKYLQKLKEDNPEKLKEYRRKAYLNMETGERPEKYRREYKFQ